MKLASAFAVSAVLAFCCALAEKDYVRYSPSWSCEWTFKQEWTDKDGFVKKRETSVNGIFLRDKREYQEDGYTSFSDAIYRIDLSDDPDNVTAEYIHSGYVQLEDACFENYNDLEWVYMKDFQYLLRVPFGIEDDYFFSSIYFERVEETTCNGEKCKKYYSSDDRIVVCTDMEGLPISGSVNDTKKGFSSGVFSFTREAPLSRFKFKRDAFFLDERIFKKPDYSLCSDGKDSSSSNGGKTSDSGDASEESSSSLVAEISAASVQLMSCFILFLCIAVLLRSL